MTVIELKIINSDWSDETEPSMTAIKATTFDNGEKGVYYFDLAHKVRVWVKVIETK